MKKFVKVIQCLSVISLLTIVINVYAETRTATVTQQAGSYLNLYFGNGGQYYHSTFNVNVDDSNYTGICIDPGYPFGNAPQIMQCEVENAQEYPDLQYLQEHASEVSEQAFGMASRMIGQIKGYSKPPQALGAALAAVANEGFTKEAVDKYFRGPDIGYMYEAAEFAKKALEAKPSGNSNKPNTNTNNSKINIDFEKVSNDATCGNVTYKVTSSKYISDVTFTCQEGCSVVSSNWNSSTNSGTIVLKLVDDGTCLNKFRVQMKYDGEQAQENLYVCHQNSNRQNILAVVKKDDKSSIDLEDKYPENCINEECSDCCNPGIDIKKYKEKDINNCCYENTESNLREWDLDDLFCKDNRLKVEYYQLRCNGEYYKADDFEVNTYCDMYCTERIRVNTPGSITAVSGRYFKLARFQIDGIETTAPYVKEFRRCRVVIKYDLWEKDYQDEIKNEILAYNNFQTYKAKYDIYKSAGDGYTVSGTATISGTCTETDETTKKETTTSCGSTTVNFSYTKYNFGIRSKSYTLTQLDNKKYIDHIGFSVIKDTNGNKTETHAANSVYQRDAAIQKIKDAESSFASSCSCGGDVSTSVSGNYPETNITEENVAALRDEYEKKANQNKELYQASLQNAEQLEKKLTECNTYFTEGNGTNIAKHYNAAKTNLKYSYEQIYQTDDGTTKLDRTYVGFVGAFNNQSCNVNLFTYTNTPDNDNDIAPDRYSDVYGKIDALAYGFSNPDIDVTTNYNQYIRTTPYKAKKIFTTDGLYKSVCSWKEADVSYYTLVPGGLVATETLVQNYVEHNREYVAYLNTYEGTYETLWELKGLGHNGRLDTPFLDTKTCANESAAGSGNHTGQSTQFTCAIKITNKLITTGRCNPNEYQSVIIDPDTCQPIPDKHNFNFKTVEPNTLFPVGTTDMDNKEYATNWTTGKGSQVKDEIEQNGEKDTTYEPSKVSYSFTLRSSDLTVIKKYNENAVSNGGYKDFNLICSCAASNGASVCTQCKSDFLTNLSNGKVKVNGVVNNVLGGWSNNSHSIDYVRNQQNHWKE